MKEFKYLVVTILVLLAIVACKTSKPIYNVAEKNLVTSNASDEQVKDAILRAASFKRWFVKQDDPGQLTLAINVRSHYAEIAVEYNSDSYQINYVSSNNLDHKGNLIHRNYNKWIMLLEQEIDRELSLVR